MTSSRAYLRLLAPLPPARASTFARKLTLRRRDIGWAIPLACARSFYNLLSSALKFTSQRSVEISAKAHDGHLRLEVRDSGIGMTDDVLSRLFENFSRADVSTTRRFGGTGLGLAVCRRLSGLMNGQLRFKTWSAKVRALF